MKSGNSNATPLKTFRLSLGLGQQQLANYLSISRSHLAKIEAGCRKMPEEASKKLADLERQIADSLSIDFSIKTTQSNLSVRKLLLAEARKYYQLTAAAAGKLEKLSKTEQQCRTMLKVISGLQNELPGSATKEKDRLWLKKTKAATLKKLSACGLATQLILGLRMEGFIAQARKAEELIKMFSTS